MPWAKIDDGFDEHAKIESLLDEEDPTLALAAIGLWLLGLTRAHREMQGSRRLKNKKPGLVQKSNIRRYTSRENREEVAGLLVKYGLWETDDDGWIIHDFIDYLPSIRTREERSKAGRLGAKARWSKNPKVDEDGKLPSSDSTLPSEDGTEPPGGWQTMARASGKYLPEPEPEPTDTDADASAAYSAAQLDLDFDPSGTETSKNLTPVQRLMGHWLEPLPHRPGNRAIGAVSKFFKEEIARGIPEELIESAIDEWVASGKGGVAILRSMTEGHIHKAARSRPRIKIPDCPLHFGSVSGNCAQCEYEHGDPAYGKHQPKE